MKLFDSFNRVQQKHGVQMKQEAVYDACNKIDASKRIASRSFRGSCVKISSAYSFLVIEVSLIGLKMVVPFAEIS